MTRDKAKTIRDWLTKWLLEKLAYLKRQRITEIIFPWFGLPVNVERKPHQMFTLSPFLHFVSREVESPADLQQSCNEGREYRTPPLFPIFSTFFLDIWSIHLLYTACWHNGPSELIYSLVGKILVLIQIFIRPTLSTYKDTVFKMSLMWNSFTLKPVLPDIFNYGQYYAIIIAIL